MRSWLQWVVPPAAAFILVTSACAGLNSGARCRITWGTTYASQQTDIATPEGSDSQITLWISAIGLTSFRGADIQLMVAPAGTQPAGAKLPSAWQFQSDETAPCPGNDANLITSRNFPGSAFGGVSNVAIAQAGMFHASARTSKDFPNQWVIWFTAAGAVGSPLSPYNRYGVAEFKLTVPGTTCPGVAVPVELTPSLRMGYEHESYYAGPYVALLDGNNQIDAAPFEPGFDRASANFPASAARGAVRVSTWGELRHAFAAHQARSGISENDVVGTRQSR